MSYTQIKVLPNTLQGVVKVKICALMLQDMTHALSQSSPAPSRTHNICIKIPYLHKQVFNFIAMRFSACANIVNASPLAINMYSVLDKIISLALAQPTHSIPLWPFACAARARVRSSSSSSRRLFALALFLMHLNPLRGACKCERQKSAADASAENERKRIKSSPPPSFP